jgi:hypothetical protein
VAALTLLYKLKEIEEKTAELYNRISFNISPVHQETGRLFQELSSDEKIHAGQIGLAINICQESKENFFESENSENEIEKVRELIERAFRFIEKNSESVTPRELLEMSLKIELNLEARHHSFYINVTDEQLKQLFQSLFVADTSHVRRIKEFRPFPN